MSSTADTDDVVQVSADGLTVRKTFAADEFPVPAIRFEIESSHNEEVAFRLYEDIPESFPMDRVGFHPDYHSDDWTAFQDNHVEFTGTIEPNERLVTVYGIRIENESEAVRFLTEPEIAEVSSSGTSPSDGQQVDDDVIGSIVAEDRNQPVKDMISGESGTVPGLEDDEPQETRSGTPDGATEPAGSGRSADRSDRGTGADADDEPTIDLNLSDVDPDPTPTEEPETDAGDDAPDIDLGFEEEEIPGSDTTAGAAGGTGRDEKPSVEIDLSGADADDSEPNASNRSITGSDTASREPDAGDDETPEIELDLDAAADAVEEENEADDAESETPASIPITDNRRSDAADSSAAASNDSRSVTEDHRSTPEPPRPDGSVLEQLATEIREGRVDESDLDALRTELDIEPAGPDIAKFQHLQSRVEEMAAYTDSLKEFLEENGTGKQLIEELRTNLDTLEGELAEMEGRMDGAESRLDDVEGDLDTVSETVDEVTTDVSDLSDDVILLGADVEDLEEDLDDVKENVEDVETELEDVQEEVTEIQDWRSQLGSLFSE